VATLEAFLKVDILISCAGKIKCALTLDFPKPIGSSSWTPTSPALSALARSSSAPCSRAAPARSATLPSLNPFVSLKEVTAYACSKAAVYALTRSLAVEGVTVNAIAAGVFRTALNQQVLDESERGGELRMRTLMGRFGQTSAPPSTSPPMPEPS
jgi:NAD(P)-dependent dehydrogenase (short-subunit alcohol dehydrogenase family)